VEEASGFAFPLPHRGISKIMSTARNYIKELTPLSRNKTDLRGTLTVICALLVTDSMDVSDIKEEIDTLDREAQQYLGDEKTLKRIYNVQKKLLKYLKETGN